MDQSYLKVLVLLLIWICITVGNGQDIINVYAELNQDVVLKCPLRDSTSDNYDLIWLGPSGSKEIVYFISTDGINSQNPVGNRLTIEGDQSAGEYNMKISNLQQSDTGTYRCVYSNQKTNFLLQLIGQDIINIYAELNKDVVLKCPLMDSSSDNFDLIWFGPPNSTEIIYFNSADGINPHNPVGNRLTIEGDQSAGEFNMKISNLQQSDTGTYRCVYSNQKTNFLLQLIGKPTKPVITEFGQPIVNKDLRLNCSVTSTTIPTNRVLSMSFLWMIGNLSLSSDSPRFKLAGSLLTIKTINKMDINTTVTCTGTDHGVPSDESDIYVINPKYGPVAVIITPSATSYSTEELKTIPDITCSADCKPNCNYRWTKDGQVTSHGSGSTLSLKNINHNATGLYMCTAWNDYNTSNSKDININVLYLDLYTIASTVIFENTQNIHLACVARGNPSEIVFQPWTHKVGSIIIRSVPGSFTSNTTVLSLPYSSYQDNGIYTCHADNKYGTLAKSKDTVVTVHDKPVITQTVITQEENMSGEISVDFYSVPKPLKVEWLQKDSIIPLSEKYRQSNIVVEIELTLHDVKVKLEGYRAQLRISSIADSDYGIYVLRIENDKGIASQQIEFKAKGDYKLKIGLSVGIGISVVIAAVALTVYIYRRRKHRNQTDKVTERKQYEGFDGQREDTNVYQGISFEGIENSQDSLTHGGEYEHVADGLELKECKQTHHTDAENSRKKSMYMNTTANN